MELGEDWGMGRLCLGKQAGERAVITWLPLWKVQSLAHALQFLFCIVNISPRLAVGCQRQGILPQSMRGLHPAPPFPPLAITAVVSLLLLIYSFPGPH